MNIPSLDDLKRAAKQLARAHASGDSIAAQRVKAHVPGKPATALKHADYLHVIARERLFASWPRLKLAAETQGLDVAAKQARIRLALYLGQAWIVDSLLSAQPELAEGDLGIACAMYDTDRVKAALARDSGAATRLSGPRKPLIHLAFSRWITHRPDRRDAMLEVAHILRDHGADVNEGTPMAPGDPHLLSPLYGAIGHANNMALGQWLLDHGADPNDGESLYHATELGHHDGLRMLLAAGASPKGTNAVFRAMDFNDHTAVRMLLEAGASISDFNEAEIGGEPPWTARALHQAARRDCDLAMVDLLLDAGADPREMHLGTSPYAFARVMGHSQMADRIAAHGGQVPLSREEDLMAKAALGVDTPGEWIDPAKLPKAYGDLVREILHLPGRLPFVKRLVALGLPYDKPDSMGLPPVQIAGWEGLPDVLGYFLSLKPDLAHVNGYGGTLLGTILHGSENAPDRDKRDHIACLRAVLTEGVALPQRDIDMAGREDVAAFLQDWAETYPGQVV